MMHIGFLTSILEDWSFEEVLEIAENHGFSDLEVACWPKGKGERRYSGVSHIDVDRVITEEQYCKQIKESVRAHHVRISALAFYPNTMDGDLEKRAANIEHLKKVILASALLEVGMVTTFIGRDQSKTLEENYKLFDEIWPDIIHYAEEQKVKIAIENCPMLFGEDQWPGGQNLMTTPVIWRELFKRLPSDYFGLNFDPSHFVWQQLDYISPIYEFKDKLFHVHFKDIKLYQNRLKEYGVMAYPLSYMDPKIPGLGDVKWNEFVSALNDVRYQGPSCIEVEDRAYEGSKEDVLCALFQAQKYLNQYII